MSLLQSYLRDETGRVMAEFGLVTVLVLTLCLVALTALRGDVQITDTHQVTSAGL